MSNIDKEIEREYYKQAVGKIIDIMDILKVFAECRKAILEGATVSQAVRAAILMYCIENSFSKGETTK